MNHLAVLTQVQEGSRSGSWAMQPRNLKVGTVWMVAPGGRSRVLDVSQEGIRVLTGTSGRDGIQKDGAALPGAHEEMLTRAEWRQRASSTGFDFDFSNLMGGFGTGMVAVVAVASGVGFYYLWKAGKVADSAGSAAVDPYKRRDDLRRMAAQTSGASPGERATALRQLAKVQASLPAHDAFESLPRFNAQARGEEIRRARRASQAGDAVSLDPLEAAVGFGRRASYDGEMKAEWKRRAMAVLHQVAKDLHLAPGTFTVRFSPGGIAVPGDATLHHDRVYVYLEPSMYGGGVGYARRCAGQKDYGGKWGPGWENHDIPTSYEGLVRLVRNLLEPAHA